MATKDMLVIGASAGGVDALCRLCAGFPPDLPAAVFVAQHVSPSSRSLLAGLLDRAGPLRAIVPEDGQTIRPGCIYVARPDHHLLVRPGQVLVRRGPLENRSRPAINALFRSAAVAYGSRTVGVVLTGLLDDGTDGLIAVKAAGGTSVIQDPADAEWPSMPRNALKRDHVDHVVPLADMADLLARVVREDAPASIPLPSDYIIEDRVAAQEFAVMEPDLRPPGQASPIACPDCGGVLNEIRGDEGVRYRCQVGHAFSPLGLADAQAAELERALGIAVRTHKDRVRLFAQMSENASARGLHVARARWQAASDEAEEMIALLERATAGLRTRRLDGEA